GPWPPSSSASPEPEVGGRGRFAALVVISALLGAACSSGDDGDSPSADPGPRPEPAIDSQAADGRIPDPTVTRATGGHGEAAGGMRYDVGAYGYQEHEFLFGGT